MNTKVRVTPEIDRELYDWITTEAGRQCRTVHGQISYILQAYKTKVERAVPVVDLDAGRIVGIQKVG